MSGDEGRVAQQPGEVTAVAFLASRCRSCVLGLCFVGFTTADDSGLTARRTFESPLHRRASAGGAVPASRELRSGAAGQAPGPFIPPDALPPVTIRFHRGVTGTSFGDFVSGTWLRPVDLVLRPGRPPCDSCAGSSFCGDAYDFEDRSLCRSLRPFLFLLSLLLMRHLLLHSGSLSQIFL